MASLATAATEKAALEAFRRDVVEASQTALVLVDFWAEWCGPCKTLGPLLDRVTAAYAPRVKLVKIDVDKNQSLAAQFQIQSIPTVYAFLGGAPVDGFQGALGETELKAFIDRLLAKAPPAPNDAAAQQEEQIAAMLEAAAQASDSGAHDQACAMLAALATELPEHEDITAAFAQALIAAGRPADADAALAAIAPDTKHPGIIKARAALALAVPIDPELDAKDARLKTTADDHALRFDVANGWLARGNQDAAADHLLTIIAADRNWNESAARDKLLQMFEAAGLSDPWSIATRARLRAILFS